MPSTAPARIRSKHPWLVRGVPAAVVVLLVAAATGFAVRMARSDSPLPADGPRSPAPVSPVVEFSQDAFQYPDSARVRQVLQLHFDSINFKSYDQWRATVVEAKKQELPEPKWRDEYATTRDSEIVVQRIEPAPDKTLRVLLSFKSAQDLADAPSQLREPCVHWHVVYPLVREDRVLRLDTGRLPGSSLLSEC